MALNNPTMTRFLAAGYVTVMYAGRRRGEAPSLDNPERVLDALRTGTLVIVDHVKNMPEVDPHSVVLYGCSAGGVVLDVAGATEVAAVAAEEPNGMWFSPLMTLASRPAEFIQAVEDPHRLFTPAVREAIRGKLRTISGPVFIARGDQRFDAYDPHKVFSEILIPDLKAAVKEVEDVVYSGQKHCFGFFGTADRGVANDGDAAASRFFTDMDAFFKRHLPTQPHAMDDSLVDYVAIGPAPASSDAVRERVAITVANEILADYVGTYEFGPGLDLVVTLEDNQLMAQAPGQDRAQLFAMTETEFFTEANNVRFEFVRGDDGNVTDVIAHMGPNDITAPRK